MTTTSEDQTIVCWIGDTDLLAFGKAGIDQNTPRFFTCAKVILAKDKEGTQYDSDSKIRNLDTNTSNSSIILTLNNARLNGIPKFSNVILLTNRPSNNPRRLEELQELYPMFIRKTCKDFNGDISVAFVPDQTNPSKGVNGWNYQEVLTATRNVLNNFFTKGVNVDQTWYNVTPGTIAQSTSLILLGKELSSNSNFIQVEKSRNRVEHCQIPFDINKVILNQAAHIESQSSDRSIAIGRTPSFVRALKQAQQIAQYPVTVLLTGESGTGKEVFAREIHRMSRRKGKFVPINCAMLSKETGVAELTGVFRGAYTDAKETRGGKYHDAINGTLFLDEIGDMPFQMQVKLLRVLQERQFERVGSNKPIKSNVRIIAATHQNLEKMVAEKTFRQDLFYRLNVFPIETPPLRERTDDIPLLVQELVNRHSKIQKATVRFTQRAMLQLMSCPWPGNVRELSNIVERLLILHPNEIVDVPDLPLTYRGGKLEDDPYEERMALLDNFSVPLQGDELQEEGFFEDNDNRPIDLPPLPVIEGERDMAQAFMPTLSPEGINLKDMVASIEISMIKQALSQSNGVVAKASEVLGLRRTTLVEKMKKYGIAAAN